MQAEGLHQEGNAASPRVRLLEAAPARMERPLTLLPNGRALAATWLYAEVTISEEATKGGEIVRHEPPLVRTERRLFVVGGDGRVYGEGGDAGMEALGVEVRLPEVPPESQLWSGRGVQAFRAGRRQEPAEVFRRVVEVVDRFIDFDHSLGSQETMAELVACYILSTWFLDAFTVIGFLWPNGDRGSGKTQLLIVVAQLAYLGQVILAGGSYATLRDLAHYGATLAFDDAENLGDARRIDPDKRALLLAGNRRGSCTVAVKEQAPGGKGWRTRYINAFCPRLFSAIRLPDPVLASRTIVVPLIRTADRRRANADPQDFTLWPQERRELLDDLWALGVAHLPEMVGYEAEVNERARLSGRSLEPWRALLAVAAWLERQGVHGLWERMEGLAWGYQQERGDFEEGDLSALTVKALMECAKQAVYANRATLRGGGEVAFQFSTAEVTAIARKLAEEESSVEVINPQRIGMVLRHMRLKKLRQRYGSPRGWEVTIEELRRLAGVYGLIVPEE